MSDRLELPYDGHATMRRLGREDAPRLLAAVEPERERLGYWLRWPHRVIDLNGALALIETSNSAEEGRAGMFGVFLDERLVGGCNLIRWRPEHARVELGVWAVSEAEGRGLMRAACAATIRYARRELRVERVEWGADVANARSRGLARRLGFLEEMVARSYDVIAGRRFDVVRASLIGPELDAF
jgi:ribosomal-protein-serine acetyltransferase